MPKVPGWYWCNSAGEDCVLQVIDVDGLKAIMPSGDLVEVEDENFIWSGRAVREQPRISIEVGNTIVRVIHRDEADLAESLKNMSEGILLMGFEEYMSQAEKVMKPC